MNAHVPAQSALVSVLQSVVYPLACLWARPACRQTYRCTSICAGTSAGKGKSVFHYSTSLMTGIPPKFQNHVSVGVKNRNVINRNIPFTSDVRVNHNHYTWFDYLNHPVFNITVIEGYAVLNAPLKIFLSVRSLKRIIKGVVVLAQSVQM